VRPDAPPADEFEHGFFADVGLTVEAKLFEIWSGTLEVAFDPEGLEAVTGVEVFDVEDGVETEIATEIVSGVSVEEATVALDPWTFVGAKIGVMRIPLTLTQQAGNTALLFPSRAPPNEVFQSGPDLGALVYTSLWKKRIDGSFGVFSGESLGLDVEDAIARSVALSWRLDVSPFGAFAYDEGDPGVGPFRLGGGFGIVYRPAEVFDEASGEERITQDDVRLSAGLRMAVRGAYVAVEYLRRQQSDPLSSRPEIADGGFAQASFFFRVHPQVALEPIARLGFVADDQAFDPRLTGWTDAGVSLYPLAHRPKPDQLKISVLYMGARRFTVEEESHGAALATRFLF